MEFGVFIQGYVPRSRSQVDPLAEHHALMEEMDYVVQADCADVDAAERQSYLEQELQRSMRDIVADKRGAYLRALSSRFPIGEGNVSISAPPSVVNSSGVISTRSMRRSRSTEIPATATARSNCRLAGCSQSIRAATTDSIESGRSLTVKRGSDDSSMLTKGSNRIVTSAVSKSTQACPK